MKMLAGYLEEAISFQQMAAEETDLKLKVEFEKQAAAYRNLVAARAKKYFGERVASTDQHDRCNGSSIVSSGFPSRGWALIQSIASCSEVNLPK